jgi:pyruvate-formate lyase-activating enzyme
MTKILCLGNNTEDTDLQTKQLSAARGSVCHGLLSELDFAITSEMYCQSGYYHSSVYDIEFGQLVNLCNQFDQVIVLDQPVQQWSHPDAFYKTLELVSHICTPVEFVNPAISQAVDTFANLVKTNKSFCIFPFIELLVNYDYTTVCCRSLKPVTYIKNLTDYKTDVNYQHIRTKMLKGEPVDQHCNACYQLENMGITSARQQETVEWANRLGITSVDDLSTVATPAYYEIRPSNKCNLQCRMCNPNDSHLIAREYQQLGLIDSIPIVEKNSTGFEIVDFASARKIYVAGGEPTIMPEFYEFLDRCIDEGHTDVEFLVNTNGTKLSERFQQQLKHFSNFHFVFSIDAFADLNYYIRWPSDWNRIIENLHYLRQRGHVVTVNTTVSIYNIAKLHELFAFVDREFPNTLVHCQIANNMSPFLYPNIDQALSSLHAVQSMSCYQNSPLLASSIDGYVRQFEQIQREGSRANLHEFFKFNDLLDQSRNVRLEDYLPELAQHRPI